MERLYLKLEKLVNVCCRHHLLLVLFSIAFAFQASSQSYGSEEELKKKASEFFTQEAYVLAMPLYSQLVSLYPDDGTYNYKYGTCLIFAEADKSKALKYLRFAVTRPGVDPRAYYYCGRALHLNYEFNEAIVNYEKFNSLASSKDKKELAVGRLIEMCRNGKTLLQIPNDVAVLGKQDIKRSDFFRSYDLKEIGGKIIVKPDEFKSKYDQKVSEYSIMHLPPNPTVLYYSSYGEGEEKGKDIFRVRKLEGGEWSQPENLGPPVNTPYDEDFPFMHSDGKTLYFSSKGHNSMGGYDVFRSTYNEATGTWSTPVNMDFAISSADDDILFISSQDNQIAYFASARYSLDSYIGVYKVLISRRPIELTVIKGKFIAESNPSLKKATITVEALHNGQQLGVFETDASGNYVVKLPKRGGTFKFILETTEDAPIHTGNVTVPSLDGLFALKQELRLVGEGDNQKLVIKNLFDKDNAEPIDPGLITDMLREKAKLEVNTGAEQAAEIAEDDSGPTLIVKDDIGEGGAYANLSNQEMVSDLQGEIKKLEENIKKLQSQANFSYAMTYKTATEADGIYTTNEALLEDLSAAKDSPEEETLRQQVLENKKKANPLASKAIAGYSLSGSLENEVKEKKLEVRQLTESLAILRSKVNAGNREEALQIYKESKERISTIRETGTAFEIEPSRLREQHREKQKDADATAAYLKELKKEQATLEKEIERNKKEAAGLRGKKQETLQNQINAFELDLEDIGFEAQSIEKKAKEQSDEAKLLGKELEMTTQLIEEIGANRQQTGELSPEDKLRLENMINYFKEQNLLDDILGDEQATMVLAGGNNVPAARRKHHPAFDEEGNPVDYDAVYEAERAAVEKMDDPAEKNKALSELYGQWAATLGEDIKRKQELLKTAETEEQEEVLKREIAALEAAKKGREEEKAALISQIADKQEAVKNTTPAPKMDDKALSEGIALPPVNAKGEAVDYSSVYSDKLTEISAIGDEQERKTKTATLNRLWSETIAADIALKQATFDKEKKKEKKEALGEEIALLQKEKQRIDSKTAVQPEAEQESIAAAGQEKTSGTENTNEETAATAANTADPAVTANTPASSTPGTFARLKEEPKAIKGEEGEVIAYNDYYRSELKEADNSQDTGKRREVLDKWSVSANAEIELRKEQLAATTDEKQRDELYALLAALQLTELKRKNAAETEEEIPDTEQLMQQYESLSKDPAAIGSEGFSNEGFAVEYDLYYQRMIELAKEREDAARETKARQGWIASREAHIAALQEEATRTGAGDGQEQLLALIAALEAMNREEREALAGKQQPAGGTADVLALADAGPVEVVDAKGNPVDYNSIYEAQLATANFIPNAHENAKVQAAVNSNWAASIANDIKLKKEKLNTVRKKKEKELLNGEIRALETLYAQKQAEGERKAQVADSLDPGKVAKERTALFGHEKLAIQYQMMQYGSPEAEASIAEAGKLIMQVVEVEEEIARKQSLLNSMNDAAERDKVLAVIESLQQQSERLQLEIAEVFSSANSKEFSRQQSMIAEAAPGAAAADKKKGDELSKQSRSSFEQAGEYRKKAAAIADFGSRKDLLRQAYELEITALRLQREALMAYTGEEDALALNGEKTVPEEEAAQPAATEEPAGEVAEVVSPRPAEPLKEPLVLTQQEADEIERQSLYQEYAASQERAARMMKEAEVEYAKSADLRTEADKLRQLAQQKKEAAETVKKKKEKKQLIEEAAELERQAAINEHRSDSVQAIALQLENDARAQSSSGEELLAANGAGEEIRNYYQARQQDMLEIRKDEIAAPEERPQQAETASVEQEPVTDEATAASPLKDLPLAEELTAEEFRKLDFTAIQEAVEKDLFIKSSRNDVSAYNASKPIPVGDEVKLPEGIIFKVQIGAFRNPIPQDLFKGFAPVSGERTASGITRYTAGIFTTFDKADQAKEEIRNLGYRDAFVVAFRDGKRISVSEALGQEGVAAGRPQGREGNVNASPAVESTGNNVPAVRTGSNPSPNPAITAEAPDVQQIEGLFYTVQVGVYSNTKVPAQLSQIRPLNSERTVQDHIRYTSGVFRDFEEAVLWRKELVNRGIRDAFITAYRNGKRISVAEARQNAASD